MRSSLFAFANFCNLSLGHSLSHSLTQTYCRSSSHFNNISSSWFACKLCTMLRCTQLCTMLRCTQFSVLAWVLTQTLLDSRYGQTLMDVSAWFFSSLPLMKVLPWTSTAHGFCMEDLQQFISAGRSAEDQPFTRTQWRRPKKTPGQTPGEHRSCCSDFSAVGGTAQVHL
jgi:hypothetical protein